METIKNASRLHPLMAAAAASVVIVSLVGAASIAGLLPTTRGATAPALSSSAPTLLPLASAVPAPLYAAETAPAPVIKHSAPRAHVVHHTTLARNDYQQQDNAPAIQQAPPPSAAPNYVGIGVGAVVGGLLGNQVGGGNGRKLATVAGLIGGGMLGNEVANRNR